MVHVLQSYCIISTGVRITCTNQIGQGKRNTVACTSGSHSMRDNIGALFGPKQVRFVKLSMRKYYKYYNSYILLCHYMRSVLYIFLQLQTLISFLQTSPTDNIKEDYGLNEAELPKDLFTCVVKNISVTLHHN